MTLKWGEMVQLVKGLLHQPDLSSVPDIHGKERGMAVHVCWLVLGQLGIASYLKGGSPN